MVNSPTVQSIAFRATQGLTIQDVLHQILKTIQNLSKPNFRANPLGAPLGDFQQILKAPSNPTFWKKDQDMATNHTSVPKRFRALLEVFELSDTPTWLAQLQKRRLQAQRSGKLKWGEPNQLRRRGVSGRVKEGDQRPMGQDFGEKEGVLVPPPRLVWSILLRKLPRWGAPEGCEHEVPFSFGKRTAIVS